MERSSTLLIVLIFSKAALSVPTIPPSFTMTVKNIATTNPGNSARDSITRFEIRIKQASKIDIRKDTLEDKSWILQFQPSTSGYPVTFTLDSSAFPSSGSFNLKNLPDGNLVNINMKNQSSYTLVNSAIKTLKIEYRKGFLTIQKFLQQEVIYLKI